jgi:hypothetical protein
MTMVFGASQHDLSSSERQLRQLTSGAVSAWGQRLVCGLLTFIKLTTISVLFRLQV